jgi:DNA-binding NtrC family response regulator
MRKKAVALVVMSLPERLKSLLTELKRLNLDILTVPTCRQARTLLRTRPPVDVVITDVTLADGNWSDVLREVVDTGTDTHVVVHASSPDAILWSEVLWRGVYDMLTEPYKEQEVRNVIEGAVRASREVAGRSVALASAS